MSLRSSYEVGVLVFQVVGDVATECALDVLVVDGEPVSYRRAKTNGSLIVPQTRASLTYKADAR